MDARSIAPAIIVIGGGPLDPRLTAHLDPRARVIAADSGLDRARAIGLQADVVVGDMDSVDPASLAAARARGVLIRMYPVDKDATDTELALDAAIDGGHARVVLVSGGGGRFDHELASLLTLAQDRCRCLDRIEAWIGTAHVDVLHGPAAVHVSAPPGSLVSLIPLGPEVADIRTSGLRWSLEGDTLPLGSSRGLSNETTDDEATVSIGAGVLAVVVPDALLEGTA